MNLTELISCQFLLEDGTIESAYCRGLISYLSGDMLGLAKLVKSKTTHGLVRDLLQLRLEIRKNQIQNSTIKRVLALDLNDPVLNGERSFVVAYAYEVSNSDKKSYLFYKKAYLLFQETKLKRKALKALQNSVAAESRINPTGNFTSKYLVIIRLANQIGEKSVAGYALLNIAREYQNINAFDAAFKYCNRSLVCFKDQPASIDYYMVIVQRCLALLSMDRLIEARRDYEYASLAPFNEIKSALKVIDGIMANPAISKKSPRNLKSLDFSWRAYARLNVLDFAKGRPTKTEIRLFEILSRGPKSKFEIIGHLYGTKIDFESLDNRFHVFMTRVRRKFPQLIVFEEPVYRLANSA